MDASIIHLTHDLKHFRINNKILIFQKYAVNSIIQQTYFIHFKSACYQFLALCTHLLKLYFMFFISIQFVILILRHQLCLFFYFILFYFEKKNYYFKLKLNYVWIISNLMYNYALVNQCNEANILETR